MKHDLVKWNERQRRRPRPVLTPTEMETLKNIASGMSDKEIASANGIKLVSVGTRVRVLRNKLGAVNRAHCVMLGYEMGLLGFGEGRV